MFAVRGNACENLGCNTRMPTTLCCNGNDIQRETDAPRIIDRGFEFQPFHHMLARTIDLVLRQLDSRQRHQCMCQRGGKRVLPGDLDVAGDELLRDLEFSERV